ncbi:MAG: ABC transporter permease [Cyclobacteriaceae bacterium]
MNYSENLREGIKSIFANKLRTTLTAMIIAIGITALVGILTAVDAIQGSINESFSKLGSNTVYINNKRVDRGKKQGVAEKRYPNITFDEARKFVQQFDGGGICALNFRLTGSAEIKRKSEKTNPNIRVIAGDQNYIRVEGYNIEKGRNFSMFEIQNGTNVALIGQELVSNLYSNNEQAVNSNISFFGNKFKVIGVLELQGSSSGGDGADRAVIIPMTTGRKIAQGQSSWYNIGIAVTDPMAIDLVMGEATGLMKAIRKDRPGSENSFDIKKRQSAAEKLEELSGVLTLGGFVFAFLTLTGASIALMNIMLVSVTERTREIGVRKALGATPGKIRQQFLIEALIITQIGGVGGIVMGIGFGNLAAVVMSLNTFVIPWTWILMGLIISMIVALASGYIPAHRASKLDPIESLRFE